MERQRKRDYAHWQLAVDRQESAKVGWNDGRKEKRGEKREGGEGKGYDIRVFPMAMVTVMVGVEVWVQESNEKEGKKGGGSVIISHRPWLLCMAWFLVCVYV